MSVQKMAHIFEIPDPELSIYYTTFKGLRERLRVVYRLREHPTLKWF